MNTNNILDFYWFLLNLWFGDLYWFKNYPTIVLWLLILSIGTQVFVLVRGEKFVPMAFRVLVIGSLLLQRNTLFMVALKEVQSFYYCTIKVNRCLYGFIQYFGSIRRVYGNIAQQCSCCPYVAQQLLIGVGVKAEDEEARSSKTPKPRFQY